MNQRLGTVRKEYFTTAKEPKVGKRDSHIKTPCTLWSILTYWTPPEGKHSMKEKRKQGIISKRALLALLFIICYLLFDTPPLHAQTADRIERLLELDTVSYQEATLLVLEASGRLDPADKTRGEEAFNFTKARGWLPANTKASNPINLKDLSILIMQTFDIKGGLFYSLFKTPHYAYRTLVYHNIIQGRADPLMNVSGELLLFTINRAMYLGANSNEERAESNE